MTVPEPIINILDTAVCANELPLTWHGITFTGTGTHTSVLQNVNGCDSTVTLNVIAPSYFLSDDFNDGIINNDKWTYTGNAVLEEDGLLKLQQNVTDQDVHLRTVAKSVPANGKVFMDRRFMVHRSSNTSYGRYFYGCNTIILNGDENSFVNLEYTYAEYYDGAYHHNDPRNGIFVISKINGVESTVRLCDITFDSWLTEHVEVDFVSGTLSFYLDTLMSTVSIPGLSSQTVNYYNVQYRPS